MSAASPAGGAGHRPALDGLRGLAAIWVLVYHAWIRTGAGTLDGLGPLAPVIRMGTLGVEVFFVLSGCVLVLRLLEGPATTWRAFAVRRLARLLPAVWVALVVAVATASLHQASTAAMARSITPESVVANATLLAGLARLLPGYDGAIGFLVDPVVWSLTPELLFSLLLVPALPWVARRPAVVLGALLAAGVVLRLLDPSPRVLSVASPLLTAFPSGIAAAWLVHRRSWAPGLGLALVLVGSAALHVVIETVPGTDAGALREHVTGHPFLPVVVAAACAALCVGLARPGRGPWRTGRGPAPLTHLPGRLLGSRALVAVGRWSYGVYLWHFPILGVLVWTAGIPADGTNRSFVLASAVALPPALLAGAASHRFIETPARRWAVGRMRRSSQEASSPVGA